MLIPPKIKIGDTIGIISPSSGVATVCPKRYKRAMEELEKRGFKIKAAKNAEAKFRYMAGTIEERVADIHQMFSDPEVKAIMCTIGGSSSQQLLEYLDYELIKNNPKILIGYSDVTALFEGIHTKTGLVTYYGPALMPQFGEFGGILDYSWDYFQKILMQDSPVTVQASKEWTDEYTPWEREDIRLRKLIPNDGFKVLKEGRAEGFLVGGNMGVLLSLSGTPYWPDFQDKILFLEDDEVETPATIDRFLTQFRQMGVFGQIQGLLIGRFHSKVGFSDENPFGDIVDRATKGYEIPIISDLDIGHTDPLLTVPIGGVCSLNTDGKAFVFKEF